MKKLLILLIIFCSRFSASAQEEAATNLFSGVLTVNHSLKISNRYQLKSSVEQRVPYDFSNSTFFNGTVNARTQLTTGIQRKLGTFFSGAFGGMYRFAENANRQRLYQQVGYVQQTLSRFKIAHRLRLDQTFSPQETEYRYRYRFGAELARRGFRTDPGESYVAFLTEILSKTKAGNYQTELRFVTQFGFLFKNTDKGEFLLELRMNDIGESPENLFLVGFSYYFSK